MAVLRTDADLNAFCLDHFLEVHDEFTDGMLRTAKLNLLLARTATAHVLACLKETDAAAMAHHAQLIVYGNGKDTLPSSVLDARERRNRQRMIEKVRKFWIEGVLEKSLQRTVLIELAMEYRPEAVAHPWDTVVQRPPDRGPHPVPNGKKLIELFDESLGELLILGAPGSGKTTMLLDLCRDLLKRAEEDESQPIPVAFHLSTWPYLQLPFNKWVLRELALRYGIGRDIGRDWLEKQNIVLLVDGIDEIAPSRRDACMSAMYKSQLDSSIATFAICCRPDDYNNLGTKLQANEAILIAELSAEQVSGCVSAVTIENNIGAERIKSIGRFLGIIKTPFELFLLVQGMCDTHLTLAAPSSKDASLERTLLANYVFRMLTKRKADTGPSRWQAIKQLSLFARSMTQQSFYVLYLEQLQPFLLSKWSQKASFHLLLAVTVLLGFCGVAVGVNGVLPLLVGELPGDSGRIFATELLTSVGAGLYYCMLRNLSFGRISLLENLHFLWVHLKLKREIWTTGLPGIMVLIAGNYYWEITKTNQFFASIGIPTTAEQKVVQFIVWVVLPTILTIAMAFMGILISAKNLLSLYNATNSQLSARSWVNQGTLASLRNALGAAVVFGGPLLTIVYVFHRITMMHTTLVNFLVNFVAVISMVLFLEFGGFAVFQHYVLRVVASASRAIPLQIVHVLEWCVERALLRKVGGGYIFIHRLLMEYFASLTDDDIQRLTAESAPRK